MADDFSKQEAEYYRNLKREQAKSAGGEKAKRASKPVAQATGRAVGEASKQAVKKTGGLVGAGIGSALPGAGTAAGERVGEAVATPFAWVTGRAARFGTRKGIEKAAETAGRAAGGGADRLGLPQTGGGAGALDTADKIPGFIARLAAKPFLATFWPLLLLIVIFAGLGIFMGLIILLMIPLGIL